MTDETAQSQPLSDTDRAMQLTGEQLYALIPAEWICVFHKQASLLAAVQRTYGLADNDGTRVRIRVLLRELTDAGRIASECRTWPDKEDDTNFHHSQCRRV